MSTTGRGPERRRRSRHTVGRDPPVRAKPEDPRPLREVTRYLSLAEFWYLAEHVTGINAPTLIKASRVELADSALHAPQAGFGDTDFYTH